MVKWVLRATRFVFSPCRCNYFSSFSSPNIEKWAKVLRGADYSEVSPSNNLIVDDRHSEMVLINMAASACNKDPSSTRRMFKSLLSLPTISKGTQKKALELLLHSYCVTDNIVYTENLLYKWLNIHFNKLSASPTRQKLLEDLESRRKGKSTESDVELLEGQSRIFAWMQSEHSLTDVEMSAGSWASVARFYSYRQAWIQSDMILDIIEDIYLRDGPYSALPPDASTGTNVQLLWRLLDAQCLLGQDEEAVVPVSAKPAAINEALISIYHCVLAVHCDCGQFNAALQVLKRMSKNGIPPTIVAVASLLKVFGSPSPSSILPIDSAVESAVSMNGDKVPSVDWVASSLQELHALHGGLLAAIVHFSRAEASSGEQRAARRLLKQYLHVLCQLRLLERAEAVLKSLLPLSPHLATDMSVLYPLIHANSVVGKWARARELYLRGVCDEDEDEEQRVTVTGSHPMAYHKVCQAMREAGELEELADFMLRVADMQRRQEDGSSENVLL